MHKKSCQKHIELNKEEKNVTKKRKTTDDNGLSRKKTTSDLVSKKEIFFACDECTYTAQSKKSLKNHKETSCESIILNDNINFENDMENEIYLLAILKKTPHILIPLNQPNFLMILRISMLRRV